MKKVLIKYQAVKTTREVVATVWGCVEALKLGKIKKAFEKRGFKDFQYWLNKGGKK